MVSIVVSVLDFAVVVGLLLFAFWEEQTEIVTSETLHRIFRLIFGLAHRWIRQWLL
jgi:hypothetical protein